MIFLLTSGSVQSAQSPAKPTENRQRMGSTSPASSIGKQDVLSMNQPQYGPFTARKVRDLHWDTPSVLGRMEGVSSITSGNAFSP